MELKLKLDGLQELIATLKDGQGAKKVTTYIWLYLKCSLCIYIVCRIKALLFKNYSDVSLKVVEWHNKMSEIKLDDMKLNHQIMQLKEKVYFNFCY